MALVRSIEFSMEEPRPVLVAAEQPETPLGNGLHAVVIAENLPDATLSVPGRLDPFRACGENNVLPVSLIFEAEWAAEPGEDDLA